MNMKDTTEILTLINRFFEVETSLEEERWLYDYFRQTANLPDDLIQYREVFVGFGELAEPAVMTPVQTAHTEAENLPTADLSVRLTPPKHRRLWRYVAGMAAMFALIIGAAWAYKSYESQMLENLYGGSYMIVDGQRIDDLRKIRPQLEQTLSLADAIEAIPSTNLIEQAEQDMLNNIQDASERERIRQLLNQ